MFNHELHPIVVLTGKPLYRAVFAFMCAALAQPRSAVSAEVQAIHHSHTNVLMLTMCTTRPDHLGAYGYHRATSPNIDRLAAQGFVFDRVVTQAPWTRASVAAIITGKYPRSMHIEDPDSPHENYHRLHQRFVTIAEILREHEYHTIGFTANPNTAGIFGFEQGYDVYFDPGVLWQGGYTKKGVHTAEDLNKMLLEKLTALPKTAKFFVHMVYIDAHTPYQHRRSPDPNLLGNAPNPGKKWKRLSEPDRYDIQIRCMDEQIGAMLGELSKLGFGEDLLIIINSDHGEAFKEGHEYDKGHGRFLYNTTTRGTWIVQHPGLGHTTPRSKELVQQVDMLPTTLELLGIDAGPFLKGDRFAGSSRAGLIQGRETKSNLEASFVRTQFKRSDKAAVVTPEYKLIMDFKRFNLDTVMSSGEQGSHEGLELYAYEQDPKEQNNLAGSKPGVVKQLLQRFVAWRSEYPPLLERSDVLVEVGSGTVEEVRRTRDKLKALGYIGE